MMNPFASVALGAALMPWLAYADPILPAPAGTGVDQQLADIAAGYQRQQDIFATAETGISLDININDADVDLVKSFFAGGADRDFQQATGRHPFSVVSSFDEYGDEGNFAGVASLGFAARLMVLRRDKAPDAEIAAARTAAIRAAQAWHVYGSIGGPGVIARGIRRVRPLNASDPMLPGTLPELIPLKDDNGHPLPATKEDDVWRAPVAPGFDDWIWMDNTSKDQVVGYALACVWLYDALKDDAAVPAEVLGNLATDMKIFSAALRTPAPETGLDLSFRDADGRLTHFHDINAKELEGIILPESDPSGNGFNALLAMAIVRGAYQVSGDDDTGRFYYEDMIQSRGYPGYVLDTSGLTFGGEGTNYSNVNMLAIAYATLARYETNPDVRAQLGDAIQHAFWDTGSDHDVSHVKQAWFDAIYDSLAPDADDNLVLSRIRENLSGFQPAPAFHRDRVNCDEQELAAKECVAIDGTTVIHIAPHTDHGGDPVSVDILPMSIRPDSDFLWRSDPHELNGSASSQIDAGGDYLAAYWFARLMDSDPTKNISPNARPWPDIKSIAKKAAPTGCRCDATDLSGMLPLLALLAFRRRARPV